METVNIQDISVTDQVRNLPNPLVEELKSLFESGEITMALMLVMLQEKNLIADGVKYITFYQAMTKVHNFKQKKSHGFLADSEEHLKFWDWAKNNSDGIFPDKLTLKSSKSAWFLCPQDKHPSEKREIYSQTRGQKCSKCKAEALSTPTKGVNDLATVRPDLIPFWSDRNEKRPDEVCYSSNEKFWWEDKDGYEYINKPNNRVRYNADWSPLHHWKNNCPDHYEVFEYIRSIVPKQYPVLIEQEMLPESKEMKDKGYKQSLYVDIVVLIGPFKLLYEVNGSEHFKYGKRYHDRKVEAAAELGHTLTHVWSHIWVMETQKCMDEIKNQIDFVLSYQTGTRGNQMVARKPVQLDGEVIYRSESNEAH